MSYALLLTHLSSSLILLFCGSQQRDMAIYGLSVAGVLLFFATGAFTMVFVTWALSMYSLFVLSVVVGGFSGLPPWLTTAWWRRNRYDFGGSVEAEEGLGASLLPLNSTEAEMEGARDGFNWIRFRDQVLTW